MDLKKSVFIIRYQINTGPHKHRKKVSHDLAIIGVPRHFEPSMEVSDLIQMRYGAISRAERFLRLKHERSLIHSSFYRVRRCRNSETIRYMDTSYGVVRYFMKCEQTGTKTPLHIAIIDRLEIIHEQIIMKHVVMTNDVFVAVRASGEVDVCLIPEINSLCVFVEIR